ncbi:MAG: alpha/beta fold hydrolase [Anaerolineales bacterium]|nr:alpha/beta fold hydrolase [Anaerolineales bacterium]
MFSVLLITLGLGQLISTCLGWRAASLVGARRGLGYGLALLLLVTGAALLPPSWWVLLWTPLAALLTLALLLLTGSMIDPPPHPDNLFEPTHPAHGSCRRVQIRDGDSLIPGYLLSPPTFQPPTLQPANLPTFQPSNLPTPPTAAVLVVHGAGDTKISFKWRLVGALLAEGLTVLTIDLPGHGDYRHRPLSVPDCLSAVPAALRFLRAQPGIMRVGLVGISLGSALAMASLAQPVKDPKSFEKPLGSNLEQVDAFVALETPLEVKYSQMFRYQEMWHAYRAPVLSLLGEVSVKQLRQSWFTGGYVSRHRSTAEVIDLLNPRASIANLKGIPLLLVHGGRDAIAPPAAGQVLQQAVPQAELWAIKGASHVTLTLMAEVNRRVARWLRQKMEEGGGKMEDCR